MATGRAPRRLILEALLVLLLLVTCGSLLRFVGERSWFCTLALYLPRLPMLLAPLVVTVRLWLHRPKGASAYVLTAASWLLLAPFLGLVLRFPAAPSKTTGLRLLTWNVDSLRAGVDAIAQHIVAQNADLIALQEVGDGRPLALRLHQSGYRVFLNGQFIVASRLPIEDDRQNASYAHHRNRFLVYHVTTPHGPLKLLNLHPPSPRDGLLALENSVGLLDAVTRRRAGIGPIVPTVRASTRVRETIVRRVLDEVHASNEPVVVLGDTNLPPGSWLYAETLAQLTDAFESVGCGLGYTYPARTPWLRIDRILGRGVAFERVSVGERAGSDHRSVLAVAAPQW